MSTPSIFHEKEQAVCPTCKKSYYDLKTLKRHFESVHEKQRSCCATCQKPFADSSSLRRHQVVHTGVRKWKCSICPASFLFSSNLMKHRLLHENPDNIEHYPCDGCGKMFRDKYKLQRHKKSTHKDTLYLCKYLVCGRRFSNLELLHQHEEECKLRSDPCVETKLVPSESKDSKDPKESGGGTITKSIVCVGKKIIETIQLNR
jgi:hypothetical protein